MQRADRVTVERPVDSLTTVDDDDDGVEVHGTSDFVVDLLAGEWYVAEVKIALTKQTRETRRQYEIQVTAYSYFFKQQHERSTDSVEPTVETFGVVRDTITSLRPPAPVEQRLAALVQR